MVPSSHCSQGPLINKIVMIYYDLLPMSSMFFHIIGEVKIFYFSVPK